MENVKPLESSDIEILLKKFSPFFSEIKKRIFSILFVFVSGTFVGFVFYEHIISFLIHTLSLEGINIVFTSPFQFINLAIVCGVVTGLISVFPFLIFQMLHFLKPALREKEYKALTRYLPLSLVLFIGGFVFGSIIMKWQIEIFLARSESLGIGNILDISGLLTTVFLTSALMGIGFQFPVIILLLLRVGIIKPEQLAKLRRWFYLGSFIFVLFLPPDSILSDILLALPLIILFELSLILNRLR